MKPQEKSGNAASDHVFVTKIFNELTSSDFLENLRLECVADVKSKGTYIQLKKRFVDLLNKKISSTDWWRVEETAPRLNVFREQVVECGVLAITIERVVDEVVSWKLREHILPMIKEILCACWDEKHVDKLKLDGIPVENRSFAQLEEVIKKICDSIHIDWKHVFKDGHIGNSLASVSFSTSVSQHSDEEACSSNASVTSDSSHTSDIEIPDNSAKAPKKAVLKQKKTVNNAVTVDENPIRAKRERKMNSKYSSDIYQSAIFPSAVEPARSSTQAKSDSPVPVLKSSTALRGGVKSSNAVCAVKSTPPVHAVKSSAPVHAVKSAPPIHAVKSAPSVQPGKSTPLVHAVKSAPPIHAVKSAPPIHAVKSAPPVHAVKSSSIHAVKSTPPILAVKSTPPIHAVKSLPTYTVKSSSLVHTVKSSSSVHSVKSSASGFKSKPIKRKDTITNGCMKKSVRIGEKGVKKGHQSVKFPELKDGQPLLKIPKIVIRSVVKLDNRNIKESGKPPKFMSSVKQYYAQSSKTVHEQENVDKNGFTRKSARRTKPNSLVFWEAEKSSVPKARIIEPELEDVEQMMSSIAEKALKTFESIASQKEEIVKKRDFANLTNPTIRN